MICGGGTSVLNSRAIAYHIASIPSRPCSAASLTSASAAAARPCGSDGWAAGCASKNAATAAASAGKSRRLRAETEGFGSTAAKEPFAFAFDAAEAYELLRALDAPIAFISAASSSARLLCGRATATRRVP